MSVVYKLRQRNGFAELRPVHGYGVSALTGIYGTFVVGGAAMAFAYDANRVTRGDEAAFVTHGTVLRSPQRGRSDDLAALVA
ncbi:hypothetical protein Ade02nite_95790 [Paractinoplanes deccanensis]|uniref:Uncharacterized protein n=1 Tax=Paractinoplanes deccanensis TaxID=113561 RepID=A0ABQ3YLQ7_9ACTN|nr:hypothetical protein Ade02nite_95790 [Actinoplanes deccanensis]